MAAYYLTADLFFSSRVVGVAQRLGVNLQVVGSPTKLLELAKAAGDCRLVIIDLTFPSLDVAATVSALKAEFPDAKVIAYGPHVHEAALTAAAAAGCDEVLSRGQFDRDVGRVLQTAV